MDFLHCWAVVLGRIFRQIVSVRVMTLINTNVVASRHIKREEVLLPVAVRHSKTPELNVNFIRGNENVTHSAQGETAFLGGIWDPSRRSEKVNFISQTTDSHFANYRFSFRKLQILISQTTDFHFANYRFPFRFVPFRFVSFRFVPFRFANYSRPMHVRWGSAGMRNGVESEKSQRRESILDLHSSVLIIKKFCYCWSLFRRGQSKGRRRIVQFEV